MISAKRNKGFIFISKACKTKGFISKACKGFTLIELLVVIALIGVLSTLILANLNSARERSRDVQRKSDLRSVQTALRLYFNDMGGYPTNNSSLEILGCGAAGVTACTWGQIWSKGTTVYMNTLPSDPQSSQSYKYTQIDTDSYTLEACLENKSDDKGIATTDTTWCESGWKYIITQQ